MEIKFQLAATVVFIADIIACSTCFRHHYAYHQELESIIQWLLSVLFGAVVFNLLVWFGAEGYVSCLQDAAGGPGALEFPSKWLWHTHCLMSNTLSHSGGIFPADGISRVLPSHTHFIPLTFYLDALCVSCSATERAAEV